jgi:transposase-like protein
MGKQDRFTDEFKQNAVAQVVERGPHTAVYPDTIEPASSETGSDAGQMISHRDQAP